MTPHVTKQSFQGPKPLATLSAGFDIVLRKGAPHHHLLWWPAGGSSSFRSLLDSVNLVDDPATLLWIPAKSVSLTWVSVSV